MAPGKKREKWLPGFLVVETWRFTAAETERIRDTLGPASDEALRRILEAAQFYRSSVVNSTARPPRRDSAKSIGSVRVLARDLLEALRHLDGSAQEHLDRLLGRSGSAETIPGIAEHLDRLERAASAFDGRGRPAEEDLGTFVNLLARIWEDVHGTWPRRSYSHHAAKTTPHGEGDSGPFLEFVRACAEPVDGSRPLAHTIRKILDGRKKHMEKNNAPVR